MELIQGKTPVYAGRHCPQPTNGSNSQYRGARRSWKAQEEGLVQDQVESDPRAQRDPKYAQSGC